MYLCQHCKLYYKVNVMVSDEVWNTIRPKDNANLLCGPCIMEKIEILGKFETFDLIKLKGV